MSDLATNRDTTGPTSSNGIDLKTTPPWEVRKLIRKQTHRTGTSGVSRGYVQANLVMLPSEYSADFKEFCAANRGPLPLLFASKEGQYDAPPLTGEHPSDIRTDIPSYNVVENGVPTKKVNSLAEYEDEVKDFCFFYLGCSFSFDQILLSAGVPLRNLDKGKSNVAMYKTNWKCFPVGCFDDCYQIVSMRPMPTDCVQAAYEATHPLTTVHGAPVHIGNPAILGISDIKEVQYGDSVHLEPGDVPVFWSCGVTGLEALKSLGIPLGFTHSPGCMFISDRPSIQGDSKAALDPRDQPMVVWLSEDPPLASSLSRASEDALKQLEAVCSDDPGKRNIGDLIVPGDLMKSALCLSHAGSVAIITGFPCHSDLEVPFETDGPLGAIALAKFLLSLGTKVTLIVSSLAGFDKSMKAILRDLQRKGLLEELPDIVLYPPVGSPASDLKTALGFLMADEDLSRPRFDCILSIEYPGKTAAGRYHTMHAKDITHLVTDMDILFEAAQKIPGIFTTAVSDSGNELGMGKVRDKTEKVINNGGIIASCVAADFIVGGGVANWGGYALCCALFLLRCDAIHDRYRRRGLGYPITSEEKDKLRNALPDWEKEEAVLKVLYDHQFHDSFAVDNEMAIDGMDFHKIHVPKLNQLLGCIGL